MIDAVFGKPITIKPSAPHSCAIRQMKAEMLIFTNLGLEPFQQCMVTVNGSKYAKSRYSLH